jgi:hypothetical protein
VAGGERDVHIHPCGRLQVFWTQNCSPKSRSYNLLSWIKGLTLSATMESGACRNTGSAHRVPYYSYENIYIKIALMTTSGFRELFRKVQGRTGFAPSLGAGASRFTGTQGFILSWALPFRFQSASLHIDVFPVNQRVGHFAPCFMEISPGSAAGDSQGCRGCFLFKPFQIDQPEQLDLLRKERYGI